MARTPTCELVYAVESMIPDYPGSITVSEIANALSVHTNRVVAAVSRLDTAVTKNPDSDRLLCEDCAGRLSWIEK